MKNLSAEEVSHFIDLLIEYTKDEDIEWTVTVIFAMGGAVIFKSWCRRYNLQLVVQGLEPGIDLWIGKDPDMRPTDWRCYQSPTKLKQLVDLVRKTIGLDKLDSGVNGFDLDEFKKVMDLGGEQK
jgi:hypothetical protein